jgi:hypothetical protein
MVRSCWRARKGITAYSKLALCNPESAVEANDERREEEVWARAL